MGLLFASLAHAGDGRLEINQTCAAVGCFAGDSAGFPVTITSAGSYVLTSNLSPGTSSGIDANVAGVFLDLNGFQIAGAGSCTATLDANSKLTDVTCQGSAGFGVEGAASIRDGTVRGFQFGILAATNGAGGSAPLRVERVTVRETGSAAIDPGGARLILTDSVISTTANAGVAGQNAASAYTVRGCIFERNEQGIYLPNGVATESVFVENAEALRSNVGGSGLVVNSSFTRNVFALTGSGPRYRSNVFEDTTSVLEGTNLGSNLCNGALCP